MLDVAHGMWDQAAWRCYSDIALRVLVYLITYAVMGNEML